MEIAAVAAFLAPFLGGLLKGTGEAAAASAEKLGATAWGYAEKLWERLSARIGDRPSAQEAVEDLATDPDNSAAQGAFTWHLDKVLSAEPELKAEIGAIWAQAEAAGAQAVIVNVSGDRAVGVGGSNSGTIITGDGELSRHRGADTQA